MRHWLVFVLACFVPVAVGCGPDRLETAPVRGHVAFDGNPLTSGRIMFWPDDGGLPAGGQIEPDGSYLLRTYEEGDGAVLGAHRVTISAVNIVSSTLHPQSFEEELKPGGNPALSGSETVERIVPGRFERRETTQLTAEVQRGANTIDFSLDAD